MYYVYVDEAGRGPIAGPVYVGIVVIEVKKNVMRWVGDIASLPGMRDKCFGCYDDSKVIAEPKREELYEKIVHDKRISYRSGSSKSTEVDKEGIVRGIRTAIARALRDRWLLHEDSSDKKEKYTHAKFLSRMKKHAHEFVIVVDGKTDFHIRKLWGVAVQPIVDGDAKVPMISAASIVAKVERDREMRKRHKKFPQYGFEKHKGYGTKEHYAMIEKYGMSSLHRKSFLGDGEHITRG